MNPKLLKKFQDIKIVLTDVDGVLTDVVCIILLKEM